LKHIGELTRLLSTGTKREKKTSPLTSNAG
jgi:hypothetical protein